MQVLQHSVLHAQVIVVQNQQTLNRKLDLLFHCETDLNIQTKICFQNFSLKLLPFPLSINFLTDYLLITISLKPNR